MSTHSEKAYSNRMVGASRVRARLGANRPARGWGVRTPARASASAVSCRLNTVPTVVFGSSCRNSMCAGTVYGARRFRQWVWWVR